MIRGTEAGHYRLFSPSDANLTHLDVTPLQHGRQTIVPLIPSTMNTQGQFPATQRFRFTTTGITCGGCANSVRILLGRLPGVVHVQVDVAAQTAEVEVERGATAPEELATTLKPAGYGSIPANA